MSVQVNFDFKRDIRSATSKKLIQTSDGDTPLIEQPIRMVSCDTPEKAPYAGKPEDLRIYLTERLTNDAAEKHISAGNAATKIFTDLLEQRLTKASGSKRRTAVIPTGEIIDTYGRLLAYIAPWFARGPNDPLPPLDDPKRRTFNLDMIENGWAAFFPIYPSLSQNRDMNKAISAAEVAWNNKRGI
jgi:endonuclease YncB( thermonuclease family)